jgi:prepilin-type processing-associated H-X9-DG protein
MYAHDNQDKLPPNHNGGIQDLKSTWACGWEDFTADNSDNTNTSFLVGTQLGQYTKNTALYKCPADTYLCMIAGQPMPRVRSISMNGFIEGGAYNDHAADGSHWFAGWWSYQKMSDIRLPSPAKLWVFADEHPDSINDCWFVTNVPDPDYWSDLPASYHNGAGSFCFADGHTELKRWVELTTLVPILQQQRNGFPAPASHDTRWLIEHSSAPSR